MDRWRRWWGFANIEQVFSFVLVTVVTIGLTSLLAHSTLFGQPNLPNNVSFLKIEAQELERTVGSWFGVLFLAVGAFSLFGSAMGIIDYTSRLAADILKTTYTPERIGKPLVFLARVGNGRPGMHDSAGRHVSADHFARDLCVDRRNHHVSVFVHAHRAESKDAAIGDSYRPIQNRNPGVVDAAVWVARRAHHLHSSAELASLKTRSGASTFEMST